ncbi:MAG: aldehyde dehydrogenase family protein [Luteitalea sp.]|nr:aldehyde dehydrogenase family protein [Luteitalea sp.]
MRLHGQSFVAGRLSRGSGHVFRAIDPQNATALEPDFHEASLDDVDRALEGARSAFADYRATTPDARAVFLDTIAEEIMALGDTLIDRAHAETALSQDRLTAERGRTCNQLRLFGSLVREGSWLDARIDRPIPDRQPLPKPDVRRLLVPIGPVVVFSASNFPLAFSVAGGDTASALAAGNPVVVKAHEAHPGTSELVLSAVARACERCRLPAGVFSLLQGRGQVIGGPLVQHPHTRAVGFTGSLGAGRALTRAAAARPDPIPVFAEMGSVNPIFVLPDALKTRGAAIAEGFVASMTLGVGQFCTKPGLLFTPASSDADALCDALARRIEAARPGSLLYPGISERFNSGVLAVGATPGVSRLAAAETSVDRARTEAGAHVFTTDAQTLLEQSSLMHEVFGPFALLVRAANVAEMEEVARALDGQLTATVHGTDTDLAAAGPLIEILSDKAGRVIFNGYPTGVEVCHAMQHGGPWPATTDARFTSVGSAAILRFVRPVCYQNAPHTLLPPELRDANPRGIWRLVDGELTKATL